MAMNRKRLEEIRELANEPEDAAEFLQTASQAIWDLLIYVEKLEGQVKHLETLIGRTYDNP